MFLTQKSDGAAIAKMKTFLMDNANQIDDSILSELTFLYEEVDMESSDLEDDHFELMGRYEDIEQKLNSNKDEVEKLTTYIEEQLFQFEEEAELSDEIMKDIKGKIDTILEGFDYEPVVRYIDQPDSNKKTQEQETIEKMIKLGYKFNGIEIEEEKPEPVKVETIKPELPKFKELPRVRVEKENDQTVSIFGYQLDVTYDIKRDKFSGKGARKHKEELKQRLEYYFKYEAV